MEEFTEFNEENADVGNEITNIIMGNAKGELIKDGYEIEMSIPSVVEGMGHTISFPDNTTVVQIPMESDLGVFFMELAYNELQE